MTDKNNSDEYISIKNIKKSFQIEKSDSNTTKCNYDNNDKNDKNDNNDESKSVYQIQCNNNQDTLKIMKVGIIPNVHDIMIKEFDLESHIKCMLVSCIFDRETLIMKGETCKLNVFKLLIFLKKKNKMTKIASLNYNIHIYQHKQENKNLLEYVSDKNNIINIRGFFTFTMQFSNIDNNINNNKNHYQTMILQTNKYHIGDNNVFNKMIELLVSEEVQKLINIHKSKKI